MRSTTPKRKNNVMGNEIFRFRNNEISNLNTQTVKGGCTSSQEDDFILEDLLDL